MQDSRRPYAKGVAIRRSSTYRGGKTVDAMGGKGSKAASETPAPELPKELDEKLTLTFEKRDDDKNGTLDQNEFIALIRKRCERPLTSFADQFSDEKLREVFDMYDDDGNNEMDADELVVAWKKVTDMKISTAEAQELINQGATNGNANLDKNEFVQVVRAHGA